MTRKSGRTGSTPRESTAATNSNNTTTTNTATTSPANNKQNKRPISAGQQLNGECSPVNTSSSSTEKRGQPTGGMTKAPRVNGVAERTSPIKTHHNGTADNLILENGFHDAAGATTTTSSPKGGGAVTTSPGMRSKRDSSGTAAAAAAEKEVILHSPRLVVLNGGDQSQTITGNHMHSPSQKLGTSYLSPSTKSVSPGSAAGNGAGTTPLYKVIDKSMSYTKSPQLLSPGASGASRLQSQSPTSSAMGDGMRSPVITKSPAEEVKSHRRGQGQGPQLSPVTSPLKNALSPLKQSASRPNTPAGVGRGGKKRTLRKNELSLLADEAENFMFPKAKEDVDSDSSDVIIIVKGKKKTKTKGSQAAAAGNVDDQTMALIKSEMGEEETMTAGGAVQEQKVDEGESKTVNLLPLKKRFGASVAAVTAGDVEAEQKVTASGGKKRGSNKNKKATTPAVNKKAAKVVKQEKEEATEEVPPAVPAVSKGGRKRATKANGRKRGAVAAAVKVEKEDEEEEEAMELEVLMVKAEEDEEAADMQETVAPLKPKGGSRKRAPKKETAKQRRKREKLESAAAVKTEPTEDGHGDDAKPAEPEEYSNLQRIMEAEELTRFRFAFERVPSMEPWFAAFNRQDEGEERVFEYYGSTKYKKLPYEMGALPPLPQNCCALSHLRGTPTKSPRKGRGAAAAATPGDCSVKPTRLFTSARISMKRDKMLQDGTLPTGQTSKTSASARVASSAGVSAAAAAASRRSLPVMEPNPLFPRRRGRPPLAVRRLQEEQQVVAAAASQAAASAGEEDSSSAAVELSAKQKAVVTKSIAERKRKLLAELEHPRKSPREHASTLAILSCLLQQRQLNREKDKTATASEEELSSEKNSETASERRDSHCFEGEKAKDEEEMEMEMEMEDEEEDDDNSEALAATTTDGDTTETEQQQERKRRKLELAAAEGEEEDVQRLLPMTPPPVPVSRTTTPVAKQLQRSNSAMSNRSAGKKKKKKKQHWRTRDSINPQELNREIEQLLADPLNASAESIDSKLLDKSDDFLLPFHECPEFSELVLSVDADEFKQSYVRKSYAPRRSLKAGPAKSGGNLLQLDYQLRSTKKRKNRTGWPTNKRRTSAAVGQAKREAGGGKRSASCGGELKSVVAVEEEEAALVEEVAAADERENDGDEEEEEGEDGEEEGEKKEDDDKRSTLTIITEPMTVASDGERSQQGEEAEEDPLQKSPILRKLLSPAWRGESDGKKELMPSPGGSPNGLVRQRSKGVRSPPVSEDLVMDCEESQSVSSVSVMVSDDPDGQLMSSDNGTSVGGQNSPSALRLFKQTTLSRFFSRKKSTTTTTAAVSGTSPVAVAGEEREELEVEDEEKEKENRETADGNGQGVADEDVDLQAQVTDDEDQMEVDEEAGGLEGEEDVDQEMHGEAEPMPQQVDGEEAEEKGEEELEQEQEPEEVQQQRPVVESRRRAESKLKNGINLNPIISIKKLAVQLSKVAGVGGAKGADNKATTTPIRAKSKKVNRSGATAAIRSKRQRRRKIA